MEVLKKILRIIFNPLSLVLSQKRANDLDENLGRRVWIIAIISVIVTALVLLICWF